MSAKSRLQLLKKIEKSAQMTEQTDTVTQDTSKNEEAAWDLFDKLFQQVLLEEVSKVGQ